MLTFLTHLKFLHFGIPGISAHLTGLEGGRLGGREGGRALSALGVREAGRDLPVIQRPVLSLLCI